MKQVQHIAMLFLTAIFISSCQTMAYNDDTKTIAMQQSKLAIMPPTIIFTCKQPHHQGTTCNEHYTEAKYFQIEMYNWIARRKLQRRSRTVVQEIDYTNAILAQAGYPERAMTTLELCELLGVDGLVTSNYTLSKPIAEDAAIAVKVLTGQPMVVNEVHANINLYDRVHARLIWNYNQIVSGVVGSTTTSLAQSVIRNVSGNMP